MDGMTGVPAHAVKLVSVVEQCATRKAPGPEFKSCVAFRDSLDLSDPIFSHPEITVLKPCSLCWIIPGIKVKEKGYKSLDETRKILNFLLDSAKQILTHLLITWFSFLSYVCLPSWCHHCLLFK